MFIAVGRKIGPYLDSPDIDYTDWWMVHFRERPDCEKCEDVEALSAARFQLTEVIRALSRLCLCSHEVHLLVVGGPVREETIIQGYYSKVTLDHVVPIPYNVNQISGQ
ncbi:MAG: hypothetical protein Q9202_004527 [Teloschistes flavicans]